MSTTVSTGIPPIDTPSFTHGIMEESCTPGLDCHDMKGQHECYSPNIKEHRGILHWASLLRLNLNSLFSGLPIDDGCYEVPRRKDSSPTKAQLATFIASLLYPGPSDSVLGPLIKYQHDIVLLRRAIVAQRQAALAAEAKKRYTPTPKEKIKAQGPWDEVNDPVSLDGVRALPMPVSVAAEETLKPFFQHLQNGGTYEGGEGAQEEYYGTDMGEWEKGILYQDGRMDLCKMVVGPPHITALIDSLETNEFVRHFLLGNNMIGPIGASRIAAFVTQHPDKIETWYLAGNCIDTASFKVLASAFTASRAITNIWLKRNPLGPDSLPALVDLIHHSSCLRTLDLDQTELGDAGLVALFDALAEKNTPDLPLKNIYLNGNVIGLAACKSIAVYLSSSNCSLESLYASNNPIGDAGSQSLALGLATNQSLVRLNLRSCGLQTKARMLS